MANKENKINFKDPVWEIPGLIWSKLTLKQARQHKTFLQQEIQRWLQDTDYLMNLRLTNLIPLPVNEWQENNPGAKVNKFSVSLFQKRPAGRPSL